MCILKSFIAVAVVSLFLTSSANALGDGEGKDGRERDQSRDRPQPEERKAAGRESRDLHENGDREQSRDRPKPDERKAAGREGRGVNETREREQIRDRPKLEERKAAGREGRDLHAKGNQIRGMVVGCEGNCVILGIGDSQKEHRVPTDGGTEIWIDERKGKLADLQAGSMATITQVEGLTTRIEARSPRDWRAKKKDGGEARDKDGRRQPEERRPDKKGSE